MTSSFEYCAGLVKEADEDRFASASFSVAERRNFLLALYAFNVEISKTRESVSEPMLGEIRLQWWREAIAEIYDGTPRQHLVVEALHQTVHACGLPRATFDALIDARGLDLQDIPFETLGALDSYMEATSTGLHALAITILDGAAGDIEARDMLARSAGRAWALVGLVRALPYRAAQGQCIIPNALIKKHDVDLNALFAGQMHAALRQSMDELLELAEEAYQICRDTAKELPSSLWPAVLHIGLLPQYLRDGRRHDFLATPSSIALWRRQLRLLQCMTFGRL